MTWIWGESFQTARHSYHCDTCHRQIHPGEEYRRWLWKVDTRRVLVMREHLDCHPDEPPHDEESVSFEEGCSFLLAA